ncbi:putative bifunctional diguanylate cyclase/phosphodiesterase [Thalassovita aquimarina]|uniref:putative bifunctional diguanylate cyclase/phosphodiesterase n=1 Tax=Thalassovita aquimarina TaxID=2785917 RepID=UPI003565242F
MQDIPPAFEGLRRKLRAALTGPHILAFLPAVVLGAFWFGGEGWLLAVSLGLPVLYALAGGFSQTISYRPGDAAPRLPDLLRENLAEAQSKDQRMACFLLALDDFDKLLDHHGQGVAQQICERQVGRIGSALRPGDYVLQRPGGEFAVVLAPVRHFSLETAIQLARRLQRAVEEPIAVDASNVYVSCAVGFVLDRQINKPDAETLLNAAEAALDEALLNGPSAIRAYSAGMKAAHISRSELARDAEEGLETGAFQPWFQPQISTDTGEVTGFEALARWTHPRRGMVPPSEFLPLLKHHGMMERLGEVMLTRSLLALSRWDEAGFNVPQIGVNFASDELRNPKLADRIGWELDRLNLPPERLAIEVLETVVSAAPNDMIARNINALSQMGCSIDLDDFGTGHASIASLRRFAVKRIKIDRSFVMKVDSDREQQRIVVAILALAEHLKLDTLAEGVESTGEHAMLAQLGCHHVQGFGIARPMPFEQTLDWIRANDAKRQKTPRIERRIG